MDWLLKALAFRALDFPGASGAHYFVQRHITRTWPRPGRSLDALSERARQVLLDYARHIGGAPETVLEIGAGRDLAVPLALRRLGVKAVTAVDIERLARLDLVQHAADRLLAGQMRFRTWDDLERFGVRYHAPHRLSAADEVADCTCSNEVLEHVPAGQLPALLMALRATTRNLTVHSIDYSDHYARQDRGLSRLNFLRYSDAEWRRFNSGKQFVNRLRHSDYLRLFREAGFSTVEESSVQGDAPDFPLAEQFKRYEPSDLYAVKGRIIAV